MMSQWQHYRQRRIAFFITWLGGFTVLAFTCMIASFIGHPLALILPVCAVWIISFFVTVIWLQRFRCPRCGQPFLRSFFYSRQPRLFLYPRECSHCALPVYGDAAD
jgi:hypothetical protein